MALRVGSRSLLDKLEQPTLTTPPRECAGRGREAFGRS